MNWLDFILLLIIALYIYSGVRNGMLKRVVELAGAIAAVFAAFKWGDSMILWVDGFIPLTTKINAWVPAEAAAGLPVADLLISIIGFLLVFVLVRAAVSIIAAFLKKTRDVPLIGPINSILGGFLGFLEGVLTVFLIVVIVSFLPLSFMGKAVEHSALVHLGRAYIPTVWALMENIFYNFFYGAV